MACLCFKLSIITPPPQALGDLFLFRQTEIWIDFIDQADRTLSRAPLDAANHGKGGGEIHAHQY